MKSRFSQESKYHEKSKEITELLGQIDLRVYCFKSSLDKFTLSSMSTRQLVFQRNDFREKYHFAEFEKKYRISDF